MDKKDISILSFAIALGGFVLYGGMRIIDRHNEVQSPFISPRNVSEIKGRDLDNNGKSEYYFNIKTSSDREMKSYALIEENGLPKLVPFLVDKPKARFKFYDPLTSHSLTPEYEREEDKMGMGDGGGDATMQGLALLLGICLSSLTYLSYKEFCEEELKRYQMESRRSVQVSIDKLNKRKLQESAGEARVKFYDPTSNTLTPEYEGRR